MSVFINNLSFSKFSNPESCIRSRIKSSTRLKSTKSERTLRPKSSPVKLNPDGLDSFYLMKRNQTVPVTANNPSYTLCERAIKSESEILKSYHFPSSPVKKNCTLINPANKQSDEVKQAYNLGPGYAIYRNESEFSIRIDSDQFFGKRKEYERKEATKAHIQDHKDMIINQLQEQISNLNVFLEEEKLNHNFSLIKCQDQLEQMRKTITENYTKEIQTLKEDHATSLKKVNKEHAKELKIQKEELEKKLSTAYQELNILKASFESYRQNLIKETDKKVESEKDQLLEQFKKDIAEKLKKQKKELKINFEVDLENLKQEHLTETDQMNSKHSNEIEVMNKRYANSIAVEEQLSQTLRDLEKRKRDYQKLQTEYDELHQTYVKSRKEFTASLHENENLKFEIQAFSDRFEERVKRVDDDYKEKIDSLQNQIVEIRRAYMSKCEELIEERKQSDAKLQGRIVSAKDVMKEIIHTRQRARISLVSLESDSKLDSINSRKHSFENTKLDVQTTRNYSNTDGSTSRPVSAPTTDQDEKLAKQKSFIINKNIL